MFDSGIVEGGCEIKKAKNKTGDVRKASTSTKALGGQ